jgi:UTP:GlnB (protein PII) uridylyltransferase
MTNLEKFKFINEFDMLDEVRKSIHIFSKKDSNNVFLNLKNEVDRKLIEYPSEIYKQYKQELMEEYKDNIQELKNLIKMNLSDTVNKLFWLKYLKDL